MYKKLFSLIVALFIGINIVYAQDTHWMPDPNLRKAVRRDLDIAKARGTPVQIFLKLKKP